MTRRKAARLDALEVGAGVGRGAWEEEAREGLRIVGAAVGEDRAGRALVLRVFANFRASYRPGMGGADLEAALDLAISRLEAGLSAAQFERACIFAACPDLLE